MVTATQKTGFLIEDGSKLGTVIGLLRGYAAELQLAYPRDLAEWLNEIPYRTYYEPIQLPLVEQIEVVEAVKQ